MENETDDRMPELEFLTRDFIKNLTDREARVLKERFGIDDKNTSSLEEVAKNFDVTRKRIRQIEEKALRELRDNRNDDGPSVA